MKNHFILFLKGMAMGVANVIPGVSGGTIALITEIYEDLIHSLKSINIPLSKNLIASLLLLNCFDEASVEWKKILSIENNDPSTINLMGTILEKQGYYVQAKKHFLRALELDKNFALAKLNIAALYLLEGNIDDAFRIYTDIKKEKSDDPEVLYRRSELALKLESHQS